MITFATAITFMRIALTPAVVVCILHENVTLAAILFTIAAATDLLDGWVARRYHQQSRLGQLLDPVADKILIMGTFFALLYGASTTFTRVHRVVVAALIAKELILLLGAAILLVKRDVFLVPTRLSRLASLSECVAIVAMLGQTSKTGVIPPCLVSVMLFGSLAMSMLLLVRYGCMIIFGRMRS